MVQTPRKSSKVAPLERVDPPPWPVSDVVPWALKPPCSERATWERTVPLSKESDDDEDPPHPPASMPAKRTVKTDARSATEFLFANMMR